MPRAKRGFKARRRRNRMRQDAKGFRGGRSKLFKAMKEAVMHAWRYATWHRRQKKRDFRALWIVRINAAARTNGVSYSKLMGGMVKRHIGLDRKVLADLAVADPKGFAAVANLAKA